VVLASVADGIFKSLPSEVRGRFATVPGAIKRLEADASALRKREDALSRAIAESAPEAALEAARSRARDRMEQAVAALETIRLDLLRLHAGVGTPDDLTADLLKAQEINESVNAELAAQAEVERLLNSGAS
jgi:hypothetical protein